MTWSRTAEPFKHLSILKSSPTAAIGVSAVRITRNLKLSRASTILALAIVSAIENLMIGCDASGENPPVELLLGVSRINLFC